MTQITVNAKPNAKDFEELGIYYGEHSTPRLVALLLGFNEVHTKHQLSFRLKWYDLKTAGAFKDCKNVGDHLQVYVKSFTK